ncbi:MAG TPA: LuxR C-terminal-related transcriptional regulator, partial [Phycisphaerae bacterium]
RMETAKEIPGYLARILEVGPISLALVQTVKDGASLQLTAFSGPEVPPSFEQELLNVHQQTLAPREGLRGPIGTPVDQTDVLEVPVEGLSIFSHAVVFAHTLEEGSRVLLVVHLRANENLSADATEILQLVAQQVGKFLGCLMLCSSQPKALGAAFERLTDREWMVLQGLNSDSGEKQLADQLGLSPHTLHSHIKSIYRKVGVQGRLPLLLRAQEASRILRITRLNMKRPVAAIAKSTEPAIAAS